MVLFDIDMPKNCYECPFLMGDSKAGIVVCGICDEVIDISEIDKKRSNVCPMKDIKELDSPLSTIKSIRDKEDK